MSGRERVARGVKRWLDVAVAGTGLALCAGPMALIAAAIRLSMGPPVLFRQARPGKDEVPFFVLKFRTMRAAHEVPGEPSPDRERLTRLGRLLRTSSLDELPQLLNVLRGEMSLVGPRPLLMRYLPHYTPRERLRFRVLPGITGLAQVSGRNGVGWDERLELDARYVEGWSLGMDLEILLRTALAVVSPGAVDPAPGGLGADLDDVRGAVP